MENEAMLSSNYRPGS